MIDKVKKKIVGQRTEAMKNLGIEPPKDKAENLKRAQESRMESKVDNRDPKLARDAR